MDENSESMFDHWCVIMAEYFIKRRLRKEIRTDGDMNESVKEMGDGMNIHLRIPKKSTPPPRYQPLENISFLKTPPIPTNTSFFVMYM